MGQSLGATVEKPTGGGSIPPQGPEKDTIPHVPRNERRALRASILVPFFMSLVFCLLEWSGMLITGISALEIINAGTVQAVIIANLFALVDLFIGYFTLTIMSASAVLLLQDYVFGVTSCLKDQSTLLLIAMVFVYIILYVLYLAPLIAGHSIFKWLLAAYTIPFIVVLWGSLREDIRHIEAETLSFSGNAL